MKRIIAALHLTLAALLVLTAWDRGPRPEHAVTGRELGPRGPASLAITNVTVIDVERGVERPAMTVVTRGEQIVHMGQTPSIPPGAMQVDGTGRYLIPGLWDMHAHHQATGMESLDLFVANGVTGTRDMGSDLTFILPLRDRISGGELLGPEIVAAGPILDAAPADWPFRQRVTNPAEAREAVRALSEQGVDFIKVHDRTPPEAFFAIADEATSRGLPFAGHVPMGIGIEEAAESGIRSIEHLSNFRVYLECSAGAAYSLDRCRALFEKLAAKRVWQTPTITFFQNIPEVFSGSPLPYADYASDSLLELTRLNAEVSNLSEEDLEFLRSNGKTSLVAIHDLFATGSSILAGCDGLVPGFCLHDELRWLTEAGLSPLEALRTATINVARFLERENTQGTIEVGRRADLVLLDADPLRDIDNTRRIEAVVVRGQLLRKPDIDRIINSHKRSSVP